MLKKVLFDVGHPAQVHQFKNLFWSLEKQGWTCLFTAKDKEITIDLLRKYDLPYRIIGRNQKGLLKKIIKLLSEFWSFLKVVNDFKPDFILSRSSLHSTFISKLKRVIHIGFSDTEHTKIMHFITMPFLDYLMTPSAYLLDYGKKQIHFNANIELFYLHPKLFIRQSSILDFLNVDKNEKYVILRFVSWDAHHDIGESGLSNIEKENLVSQISQYAKIFITSEGELPKSLEPFKINIPIEKIHDALAFANLYIGEGGTMASEAACLGTPSIYINSLNAGIIMQEVDYKLITHCQDYDEVIGTALEILEDDKKKPTDLINYNKFIEDSINVTGFVQWFLLDFPASASKIKNDPNYQFNFK